MFWKQHHCLHNTSRYILYYSIFALTSSTGWDRTCWWGEGRSDWRRAAPPPSAASSRRGRTSRRARARSGRSRAVTTPQDKTAQLQHRTKQYSYSVHVVLHHRRTRSESYNTTAWQNRTTSLTSRHSSNYMHLYLMVQVPGWTASNR